MYELFFGEDDQIPESDFIPDDDWLSDYEYGEYDTAVERRRPFSGTQKAHYSV